MPGVPRSGRTPAIFFETFGAVGLSARLRLWATHASVATIMPPTLSRRPRYDSPNGSGHRRRALRARLRPVVGGDEPARALAHTAVRHAHHQRRAHHAVRGADPGVGAACRRPRPPHD